KAVRIAAGRDVASRIPGAQFVEVEGQDHWFFAGDQQPVLAAIGRFIKTLKP
ncbi:alpha/beta hydrolase, partial [Pseudomonas sp. FW305-BF15]